MSTDPPAPATATTDSVPAEPARADLPADQPGSPTRRSWVWWSLQQLLRIGFAVWFRYRAYGVHKLPRDGAGLLLINHQSFLDPLVVGLPLARPVSYLARHSLFRAPVIGWILRHTYVIPIQREGAGTEGVRRALERLQRGFLVGIFPEGTRSDSSEISELKPGFVALVRRANVPVFPVGVAGTGEALPRHAWFARPSRCCVVFGDALPRRELAEFCRSGDKDGLLQLARQRMVACQHEAEKHRRGRNPSAVRDE